jgi:hypothetical protein
LDLNCTVLILLAILRSLSWTPQHKDEDTMVFRTREEMVKAWTADGGKLEDMPKVDFDKEMVLAVFLGKKPTDGYSVKIETVAWGEDDGKIIKMKGILAPYRCTAPAQDAKVQNVLTYPACVVVIAKHEGKVLFFDTESDRGRQFAKILKERNPPPPEQPAGAEPTVEKKP